MKILIVDDEPDVVESVRLGFTLQWREVDVIGTGEGERAVDIVEQEAPDLVLLDVGLPDLDGYRVLERIREFSDVPIIMLTARDDTMDKVRVSSSAPTTTSPSRSTTWSSWHGSRPCCVGSTCRRRSRARRRFGPAIWR